MNLVDEDGIMVGESFSVKLNVTKLCEEKRTIAKLTVDVYMKRYNGKIEAKVTSHILKDIELAGKSGEGKKWSGLYTCRFEFLVYYLQMATSPLNEKRR